MLYFLPVFNVLNLTINYLYIWILYKSFQQFLLNASYIIYFLAYYSSLNSYKDCVDYMIAYNLYYNITIFIKFD